MKKYILKFLNFIKTLFIKSTPRYFIIKSKNGSKYIIKDRINGTYIKENGVIHLFDSLEDAKITSFKLNNERQVR